MGRAVAAARGAFDAGPWPRLSPAERGVWLNKIADGWEMRSEQLGDTWALESGVLRSMSIHSAKGVAAAFRYYAGLGESFAWTEKHRSGMGQPALLVREPVGVVAAIIPWNAPHSLMAYKVAAALIAGCTVIIKASPEAPASPYFMAEICEEIGLPAGVVNVLTAERVVSELLVRDPRVDKVSFTGSTSAGRKIAAICGERIARVTLELGGKSPAVILDDYDVAKAAESIARAAPIMTGQVCASLTRIIVGDAMMILSMRCRQRLKKSMLAIPLTQPVKWGLWRWRGSATAWSVILPKVKLMARVWPQAVAAPRNLIAAISLNPQFLPQSITIPLLPAKKFSVPSSV